MLYCRLIASYANRHKYYILSEDSDLFIMSEKGMIYYESWLSGNRSMIMNSYKRFCETQNISYTALLFTCSLVGNDAVRTGYTFFSDAISYTRSQRMSNRFKSEKEYYSSLFKELCDNEDAEWLFEEFCQSYEWKTARTIPKDYFYTNTSYNENNNTFRVPSSYAVSKVNHLLYSWIYKSPVLVNPFSQSHGT